MPQHPHTHKTLESIDDRAIRGAPPLFPQALHVGRPNIGNRARLLERINDILDRQWLTNNGPMVQELEKRLAEYLHVRHCVVMCNGTVAWRSPSARWAYTEK